MSYLGILGKCFGDAGLQDILIESEVVALGSINGVINGHHYNHSMRAHMRREMKVWMSINEIKCVFQDRTMDVLCANYKFDKMCSKYVDCEKKTCRKPNICFLEFIY